MTTEYFICLDHCKKTDLKASVNKINSFSINLQLSIWSMFWFFVFFSIQSISDEIFAVFFFVNFICCVSKPKLFEACFSFRKVKVFFCLLFPNAQTMFIIFTWKFMKNFAYTFQTVWIGQSKQLLYYCYSGWQRKINKT